MLKRSVWFSLLLTLVSVGASSQSWLFDYQRLTVADGLSKDFVNCLLQDSLGFVWIGTQSGLNRYDGSTMEQWFPEARITDMELDDQGRIWVSTNNGVYRFDSPYLPPEKLTGLWGHTFTGLTMATYGTMYAFHSDSIYRSTKSGELKPFIGKRDLSYRNNFPYANIRFMDLLVLDSSNIWVSVQAGGVVRLNAQGEVLLHKDQGGWAHQLRATARNGNQTIHVTSKHELWSFDLSDSTPNYQRTSGYNVSVSQANTPHRFTPFIPIPAARNTTFFTSSYEPGLYIPPTTNQPGFIWNPAELDFSKTRCSMVDRNQLIWVGTRLI